MEPSSSQRAPPIASGMRNGSEMLGTQFARRDHFDIIVDILCGYYVHRAGDPIFNYILGLKTPMSIAPSNSDSDTILNPNPETPSTLAIRTYCSFLVEAIWKLGGYIEMVEQLAPYGVVNLIAVALWLPPRRRIGMDPKGWRELRRVEPAEPGVGIWDVCRGFGVGGSWRWLRWNQRRAKAGRTEFKQHGIERDHKRTWHLHTIAIHPEYRHHYADCFSQFIKSAATRHKRILTVDATSEAHKNLFSSKGFKVLKELHLGQGRVTPEGITDPKFASKFWRRNYTVTPCTPCMTTSRKSSTSTTSTTPGAHRPVLGDEIPGSVDRREGVRAWVMALVPESEKGPRKVVEPPKEPKPDLGIQYMWASTRRTRPRDWRKKIKEED